LFQHFLVGLNQMGLKMQGGGEEAALLVQQ